VYTSCCVGALGALLCCVLASSRITASAPYIRYLGLSYSVKISSLPSNSSQSSLLECAVLMYCWYNPLPSLGLPPSPHGRDALSDTPLSLAYIFCNLGLVILELLTALKFQPRLFPLVWLPEAGESGSSYALTITRLVFGRLHPEN
jgi:hypothetical protein